LFYTCWFFTEATASVAAMTSTPVSTGVQNQVHYLCSLWFYWYSKSSSLFMFTMVLLVLKIKFTMVLLVFTIKVTIDGHYGSTGVRTQIHYWCSLWFYWCSRTSSLLMFTMVLLVFTNKFTIDVHYGSSSSHKKIHYVCSLWFYCCSQSSLVLMFTIVLLVFTIKFTMVLLVFTVNVLYICTPF
jgi:hypothetical protein